MPPKENLKLASFGSNSASDGYWRLTYVIDGGGVRAFSQLEIMENIMHRLNWDEESNEPIEGKLPCDYFDLIGGSGTGG